VRRDVQEPAIAAVSCAYPPATSTDRPSPHKEGKKRAGNFPARRPRPIVHGTHWCIAKNGGGYTQRGVDKGLKVPCLFMITDVSIRCQKSRRLVYGVYPRIPPNTPLMALRRSPPLRSHSLAAARDVDRLSGGGYGGAETAWNGDPNPNTLSVEELTTPTPFLVFP